MRTFFSVLIFTYATLVTFPARAALVLYEPFAYPAGDSLDGTEGAAVNAGGKTAPNGNKWFALGYGTQPNYNSLVGTQVVDLNLAVAGLQEPTGNAVWYGGGGYSTRLATGTLSSGTVYASFAFRIFDITGLPGGRTCRRLQQHAGATKQQPHDNRQLSVGPSDARYDGQPRELQHRAEQNLRIIRRRVGLRRVHGQR